MKKLLFFNSITIFLSMLLAPNSLIGAARARQRTTEAGTKFMQSQVDLFPGRYAGSTRQKLQPKTHSMNPTITRQPVTRQPMGSPQSTTMSQRSGFSTKSGFSTMSQATQQAAPLSVRIPLSAFPGGIGAIPQKPQNPIAPEKREQIVLPQEPEQIMSQEQKESINETIKTILLFSIDIDSEFDILYKSIKPIQEEINIYNKLPFFSRFFSGKLQVLKKQQKKINNEIQKLIELKKFLTSQYYLKSMDNWKDTLRKMLTLSTAEFNPTLAEAIENLKIEVWKNMDRQTKIALFEFLSNDSEQSKNYLYDVLLEALPPEEKLALIDDVAIKEDELALSVY